MAKRNDNRVAIGPKLRFEVLKRDSFTCQYCGRMSPDVVLEIDHIKPVAEGGDNDILNLITSCKECNSGKNKYPLSDEIILKKQQDKLLELSEKKEQLEQMIEWRKALQSYNNSKIENVAEYYEVCYDNLYQLDVEGKRYIEKALKKYSFDEVVRAVEIASNSYEFEIGITKLSGICWNRKQQQERPWLYYVNYINKVMKSHDARIMSYETVQIFVENYIHNDEEFERFKNSLRKYTDDEELKEFLKELRSEVHRIRKEKNRKKQEIQQR